MCFILIPGGTLHPVQTQRIGPYRIGQNRPVHVYAYICSDTIEERIGEILVHKRILFAVVIDRIEARILLA
jgi:hypothetical protein